MGQISQDLKDALGAEVAAMVDLLANAQVVDIAALQAQIATLTAERDAAIAARDALQVKIDNAILALS